MKTIVVAFGALLAGATVLSAETMTTVICGDVQVTIDEKQTMMMKENTGEEDFGKDVCASLAKVDTSTLDAPMDVKVTMSNGMEYDVKLAPAE